MTTCANKVVAFLSCFDMLFGNSIHIAKYFLLQSGAVFSIASFNHSQHLDCEIKVLTCITVCCLPLGRARTTHCLPLCTLN